MPASYFPSHTPTLQGQISSCCVLILSTSYRGCAVLGAQLSTRKTSLHQKPSPSAGKWSSSSSTVIGTARCTQSR